MPNQRWGYVVLIVFGLALGVAVAGLPSRHHDRPLRVDTVNPVATTSTTSPPPTAPPTTPPPAATTTTARPRAGTSTTRHP